MQTHKIGRIGSVGSVMVSARAGQGCQRPASVNSRQADRPLKRIHKSHEQQKDNLKLYENLRVYLPTATVRNTTSE